MNGAFTNDLSLLSISSPCGLLAVMPCLCTGLGHTHLGTHTRHYTHVPTVICHLVSAGAVSLDLHALLPELCWWRGGGGWVSDRPSVTAMEDTGRGAPGHHLVPEGLALPAPQQTHCRAAHMLQKACSLHIYVLFYILQTNETRTIVHQWQN